MIGAVLLLALATTAATTAVLPMRSAQAGTMDVPSVTPTRILLLGDSYTAGNGAGNYYGPTGCYRSHDNWGERVARQRQARGYVYQGLRWPWAYPVSNAACSGGVISDITNSRTESNGPVSGGSQTELLRICQNRAPQGWNGSVANVTSGFFGWSGVCQSSLPPQINSFQPGP